MIVIGILNLIVQDMAFVECFFKPCFGFVVTHIQNQRDVRSSFYIDFKLRTQVVRHPRIRRI